MQKLLFGFAFLTHPVLIPFYSLLIYRPFLGKYDTLPLILFGFWILFVFIIFPVLYLYKVKKIDFRKPSIEDRKSIYKGYAGLSLVLCIVSTIVMKEYVSFFIAMILMHVFLYLLAGVKLKASWHSSSWAFLLMTGLIAWYKFGFTIAPINTLVLLLLTVTVFLVRWKQNAHTLFELTMGLACGITAAAIIFFI